LIVDAPNNDCFVDLDRIRIRQVLLNLLTNAMRYTEQGWLRIRTESVGSEVTVLVQDSGRGIAPDKLKRAFESFDRLDEEELTHGSGLGLAVSKKFVELHQGRIWIASVLGEGTTVGFTLPLPTAPERLPLSTPRISQPLQHSDRRPLALVIHDDTRVLGLLRRHIGDCDFVLAEKGDEAEAILRDLAPDLAIVDVRSTAVWERLLDTNVVSADTLVVVTPLPSVHQFGLSLGASDYLPKPVTREDVVNVLQRLQCRPNSALVVDDDPHIVRLIGRMLRSIAPEVHVMEAFDGAEALDVARVHRPDIVFVDLNMPGMSGQQFIHAARCDPDLAATPLIVVSVRNTEEEATPIQGDMCIRLERGYMLSELLGWIETIVGGVTRMGAASPASASARLATLAD
jgi:CheY-like chemotaxis protein